MGGEDEELWCLGQQGRRDYSELGRTRGKGAPRRGAWCMLVIYGDKQVRVILL